MLNCSSKKKTFEELVRQKYETSDLFCKCRVARTYRAIDYFEESVKIVIHYCYTNPIASLHNAPFC